MSARRHIPVTCRVALCKCGCGHICHVVVPRFRASTGASCADGPRPQFRVTWCAQPFTLRRVVISHTHRARLVAECAATGVPYVVDEEAILPLAGDLWVGCCPAGGWAPLGDLNAEIAWLRVAEAMAFSIVTLVGTAARWAFHDEAMAVIADVDAGRLKVTREDAEGLHADLTTSNGWRFRIFLDGSHDEWDYVDSVTAPDGRVWDYGDAPQSPLADYRPDDAVLARWGMTVEVPR